MKSLSPFCATTIFSIHRYGVGIELPATQEAVHGGMVLPVDPAAVSSEAAAKSLFRPLTGQQSMLLNEETPKPASNLFGRVVHAYTRKQALADGFQVEVSNVAVEAGIKFRVFLTRAVFESYVAVPPNVSCQDEQGRLWDILWMLHFAIRKSRAGADRLPFALYVRNDNRSARLVKLLAACGPVDMDDPQPAITIMLPDED